MQFIFNIVFLKDILNVIYTTNPCMPGSVIGSHDCCILALRPKPYCIRSWNHCVLGVKMRQKKYESNLLNVTGKAAGEGGGG